MEKVGDVSRFDCVIEPSAGAGAFFLSIDHSCVIGMDIDPRHDRVMRQDWLEYTISVRHKNVLVVGNPPYGRYHRLSSAFIRHAMSFSSVQTIAFILPDVYRKHTRQRIIPENWRIVSITELPRNSFLLDGKDYHVPTSFFVLDKSSGPDLRVRLPARITGTKDFEFASSRDFDVFVFGASPGKVILNPTPNNRGYYLKAKIPVPVLIDRIRSVDWKGNSCATGGVYWLTKHEFVEQYRTFHQTECWMQTRAGMGECFPG